MTHPDPRVDAYIDGLPGWQREDCRQVRELIHDADPEVAETIRFHDRPYFVREGDICALLVADNRAGGWRKLTRERSAANRGVR